MVENTSMLQLGFNPLTNTSKKRNKKEKAANRSSTSEAQRQADWLQLARVWVTAQAESEGCASVMAPRWLKAGWVRVEVGNRITWCHNRFLCQTKYSSYA
jgi:hypothetical protein